MENVLGMLMKDLFKNNGIDVMLWYCPGCWGYVLPDLYKGQVFCKNSKNVWDELKETYDIQDGSLIYNLHNKIYTLTQSDDVFGSVRSIILTSDPIPDVKSAFATLSIDESHINSNVTSKSSKSRSTAFATRSGNNNWGSNKSNNNNTSNSISNNWALNINTNNGSFNNNNDRRFGRVSNIVCKHCNMTNHSSGRCFELVGYPPGFKKNVNKQNNSIHVHNSDMNTDQTKSAPHTLTSDRYQRLMTLLSGTCDTSKGFASIAGTIIFPNHGKDLIAKDVLVVPGYHVSLLSVHKLSKEIRLGHPSDQVLVFLKDKIKDLNKLDSGPCDIFHKAKQTREPFPLSEHKTKHLGDLVHLDIWGPYKVTSMDGFRVLTVVDDYTRAVWVFLMKKNENSLKSDESYDDGGDCAEISSKSAPKTSTQNSNDSTIEEAAGNKNVQTDKSNTIDITGSTYIRKGTELNDDEYESEGEDIESFGHLFGWSPEPTVGQTVRRSSRKTSISTKYQDYVLDKNVKYGIDKVVNYSNLSMDNFVFSISINKIHEPTTYHEAVKDSRWIEAMNQEIEALIETILEDVYMSLPEGFSDKKEKKVCKLVKSLFGLKQAPWKWNEKLSLILFENGFVQSVNDFSLFIKNDQGIVLILLVYADDIIVTGETLDHGIDGIKHAYSYIIVIKSTNVVVMALPAQNINHSAFRSMFEREKLSGNNFNDWFRQLKLVLRVEKKMYVIEQPLPAAPAVDSQAQFENSSPYEMIKELKSMFEKQAGVERFDLIQTFHACKQEECKPIVAYVLQMKGYVDQLERLGYMLPQDLIVGLILNGLTKDFAGFVRNYNMHNMGKTIGELYATLIEYEKGLPKKAETPQVMMIKGGKIQKNNKKSLKAKAKGKANGKGKDKQVYIPKPKNPKPSAKEHPAKMTPATTARRWVIGRGTGFREARKLKQGALYLYVDNGVRAQVEAIGSYDLVLPNGLVIVLDNCHYAPSITRGVVSVHRLVENGFVYNGIYEIDMHDLVPNVNSIYNVSTKRAKHNLDSTYLWHCRLAHISKKCIEKLQQEGLLKSIDDESFDQCVSCLLGKMTRKSFPHHPKRATDFLGIIHTDVCGPLRHVSRQGASYFITFTNNYSRYGYVYILKHKHEVFETFKVFKNEVENQLGKIIKALQSDRGGEYISQAFKDYLKACGIVQQLTPPYTPQHNKVSERRNHTLLDMVRSMMNLITLPLSFWDYALESATRILNMVPTKKVDKTPYELWYGKVPNLSYLKVWGCEALVKRDTPDKLQQRYVKYAEFFEKNLITQEVSGRAIDLEEIQDEDTSPSDITSKIPMEVEGFEPPQEEVILIRRSKRTHRAPDCLCLNVEAEEHSLRDLNEPTSYKAAMLDSESNKWIDSMNVEIQSMMDNMVWVLVDLPPGCKTFGSKWIFKKKTDMDGIVHTYKARLIAKGYTQLYRVDYEETFSPVTDIRSIRILISIAAFYDYEIWKMDVKLPS
ncbi:retrotransposon protein, putative, ty1-copia subclass [Tanacetum coccineum]